MKIKYIQGDLLKAPEIVIIHGCNCKGVMGSGVAKLIKEQHPLAFKEYRKVFEETGLFLGDVIWVHSNNKIIANCLTQQDFGTDKVQVDYDAVECCMTEINRNCIVHGITAVAMPKIGAGLAGGDWNIIEKIIETSLTYPIPVVYKVD